MTRRPAASAEPAPAESIAPSDGRRFARAALAGSAIATLVFLALLVGPHGSLASGRGLLSAFLDAQARALLHGHLSVPPAQASIEGIVVHGRTYLYFGIWPSLIRLPVMLVTHSLDGRLSELSMLLAFLVLMAGTAALHWQVRRLVRPGAAVARSELWAAAIMQVAVGAGSVVLYLASWPVVYHETELWGAGAAIAGLAVVLAAVHAPRPRRILAAGLLAALAVNSRPSVGLAPGIALMVIGLAPGLRPRARSRRFAAWFALAGVLALSSGAAVEVARFHQFGLPLSHQVGVNLDAQARASLAANGGSVFGLQFVPTTLLAALRPDAIGGVRAFPFVGTPRHDPTLVGSAVFESVQPSLSATTSMPLLCLLTVFGLPALLRRRELRPLAAAAVAAAVAIVPVLTLSDIATRYLSDGLPLLTLGGLVGLQVLLGRAAATGRGRRRALVIVASLLTAWGIVVNGGAGLVLQRLLAPDTAPADRAAFVRAQDDVDRLLGRRPRGVRRGTALPPRSASAPGDLFIVGQCAGLYAAGIGGVWLPVERTASTGVHQLELRLGAAPAGPRALLTLGSGPHRIVLTVHGSRAAAQFAIRVGNRVAGAGPPMRVGVPATVQVAIDRFASTFSATVTVDGQRSFAAFVPGTPDRETIGADPADPALRAPNGEATGVRLTAPVCHRVLARLR